MHKKIVNFGFKLRDFEHLPVSKKNIFRNKS